MSDEVETSPIEVAAVAFEDEGGAVRAFICNLLDAPRDVSLTFRETTIVRMVEPGALVEVALAGDPVDRDAYPAPLDAPAAVVGAGTY